jgi:hypothetical protein
MYFDALDAFISLPLGDFNQLLSCEVVYFSSIDDFLYRFSAFVTFNKVSFIIILLKLFNFPSFIYFAMNVKAEEKREPIVENIETKDNFISGGKKRENMV